MLLANRNFEEVEFVNSAVKIGNAASTTDHGCIAHCESANDDGIEWEGAVDVYANWLRRAGDVNNLTPK